MGCILSPPLIVNNSDQISKKTKQIVTKFVDESGPKYARIHEAPQRITRIDCHHTLIKTINQRCETIMRVSIESDSAGFQRIQSPFVTEYLIPLINLCELIDDADRIVVEVMKLC